MGIILAKRFALFALVWVILSRGDPSALTVGALAAAGAAWISIVFLPPGARQVDLMAVVRLAPGFVVRSIRGGFDVAWRALHPAMPIHEGWIVYRTRLPAGPSRVSFGSEMSLLPGSLVAGGRGDRVYVHCLDTNQDIVSELETEEGRIATTLPRHGIARTDA